MLVAGLLKELKIANVGILEGMSRNRLKQDISTFHELQRFLSGLSGLSVLCAILCSSLLDIARDMQGH